MALTLYYLYLSFHNPLPWSVCDPEWAPGGVCPNSTAADNITELVAVHNKTWSELFWE